MYLQFRGTGWHLADNLAIAAMQLIRQGKIWIFLYNDLIASLTLFSTDLFETVWLMKVMLYPI